VRERFPGVGAREGGDRERDCSGDGGMKRGPDGLGVYF
jgi:hypothetical protein